MHRRTRRAHSNQNLPATDTLGAAFYAPIIGDGDRTPNLARFQFLDPAACDFYRDWELFAEMCVAIRRTEADRDPQDKGLQDLVGELSTQSDTFRRLWGAQTTADRGTGAAVLARVAAARRHGANPRAMSTPVGTVPSKARPPRWPTARCRVGLVRALRL